MAKAKSQPITQEILKKALSEAFDAFGKKIDNRFEAVNKRFDEQDIKITNLQFDTKDLKRNQQEILKQEKMTQQSVLALDKRVRYQEDFPERLEQAESDIHGLKRDVHYLKTK